MRQCTNTFQFNLQLLSLSIAINQLELLKVQSLTVLCMKNENSKILVVFYVLEDPSAKVFGHEHKICGITDRRKLLLVL